jgi:acyl-CoA synthetase (AMP-forming)/AMP-acid ligase II
VFAAEVLQILVAPSQRQQQRTPISLLTKFAAQQLLSAAKSKLFSGTFGVAMAVVCRDQQLMTTARAFEANRSNEQKLETEILCCSLLLPTMKTAVVVAVVVGFAHQHVASELSFELSFSRPKSNDLNLSSS